MERNMTHRVLSRDLALAVLLVGSLIAPRLVAREQPASSAAAPAVQPGRGAAQGPTVTSPEVRRDRRVTFRILAPAAQKVELRSPGDIPGVGIRRMHIYTPPGYETSRDRYPVLYLLHGAGDVDDSWTSVGRARFILDNLIAASSAKPMIVVMPAGHVNGAGAALGGSVPVAAAEGIPGIGSGPDPFANDFMTDLMPYVEKNYRVLTDRQSRAIAGLSM